MNANAEDDDVTGAAGRAFSVLSVLLMAIVVGLTIGTVLLVRLNTLADINRKNGEYVKECTTPGTNPPPDTGHPCFDQGTQRTAEAVGQIIDTNGNGIADVAELAALLGVALPPETKMPATSIAPVVPPAR